MKSFEEKGEDDIDSRVAIPSVSLLYLLPGGGGPLPPPSLPSPRACSPLSFLRGAARVFSVSPPKGGVFCPRGTFLREFSLGPGGGLLGGFFFSFLLFFFFLLGSGGVGFFFFSLFFLGSHEQASIVPTHHEQLLALLGASKPLRITRFAGSRWRAAVGEHDRRPGLQPNRRASAWLVGHHRNRTGCRAPKHLHWRAP